MTAERCQECGFDGDDWTDAAAIEALESLSEQVTKATKDLSASEAQRRVKADAWSIAEYVDHVREVLFAMRFLLETALERPGTDLGDPPEPRFDREPRRIEVEMALAHLDQEALALAGHLKAIAPNSWSRPVRMGRDEVDVHWIARHAVHDATHHLEDIVKLRMMLHDTA